MRGRCTVECLAVDICPLESTVPCRWQGIARPAEQCISNQIVGKGLAAPPLPPAFIIREWPGSESQRRPSGHNARSILQEDRERHRGRTTALTGSIRTARRPISISTALQRAWRILPDASTHRRWFGACAEWGDVLQCSVRPKTRGEPLQYRGVAIAAPPIPIGSLLRRPHPAAGASATTMSTAPCKNSILVGFFLFQRHGPLYHKRRLQRVTQPW